MNKRLFIAIDLPPEIIKELFDIQQQLRKQSSFQATYVKPEQLHLTLAFLGDVAPNNIDVIKQVLQLIKMPSFQACLGKLGYFPDEKYIHIIWIELLAKQLHELALQIAQTLKPLVVLETREFVSHITLARVKKVFDRDSAISHIQSIGIPLLCFTVNQFILKESILSSQGSTYLDIKRYSL